MTVPAGAAVRVFADGAVETFGIQSHGPDWDWVQQVAPPFEIDGHTVVAFLDWVSRETGLRIDYSSPEVREFAAETVLHGTIADLTPLEAPKVVLPSCGLDVERADAASVAAGTLMVVRPGRDKNDR
jgi:hypothetical protein